jgi:hypothetical protein
MERIKRFLNRIYNMVITSGYYSTNGQNYGIREDNTKLDRVRFKNE